MTGDELLELREWACEFNRPTRPPLNHRPHTPVGFYYDADRYYTKDEETAERERIKRLRANGITRIGPM